MKKQILNLGKALNRAEQLQINGGKTCIVPGFGSYPVEDCNECVNDLNPGGPAACVGF
ncbi:MAG: hypothetical protein ABJH82_12515 [Polaribacter sp.]|uniref:hypothetical protein n=1 Tax=Polaribacter sp. TaxID=1920175 RepID=UPI0032656231